MLETLQGEVPLKVGFNLLVVGGFITAEHGPLFEKLKALGYDGVELPMFEGTPEHYRGVGRVLRDCGLEATTCAIMTEADLNSADLYRADLRFAVLTRADLRNADLRMAQIEGTTFDRADMQGALFSH